MMSFQVDTWIKERMKENIWAITVFNNEATKTHLEYSKGLEVEGDDMMIDISVYIRKLHDFRNNL